MEAGHPLPDARAEAAARAVMDLVGGLGDSDHLLFLVSGGASSLLALPASGLTLGDKCAATDALMRNGAPIAALNTVRKHLSAIKGGWLAASTRAAIDTFSLSDVLGNAASSIGSGPTVGDPTDFGDALAIARSTPAFPARAREHLAAGAAGRLPETPKPGDQRLARSRYLLIAEPADLVYGALGAAGDRDLRAFELEPADGEVEEVAAAYARLGSDPRSRGVLQVGVGEPTVRRGGTRGRGGRAQHLALLMACALAGRRATFLAAGSDGMDGTTEAAGAIVDGSSWDDMARAGVDRKRAIAEFDSHRALDAVGALVVTGPTRTNLLDLHLLLVE
jgi:glycerate-2-kinase